MKNRRGLGSSSARHVQRYGDAMPELERNLREAEKAIEKGRCAEAIDPATEAFRLFGSMQADRMSAGKNIPDTPYQVGLALRLRGLRYGLAQCRRRR